MNKIIITLFFSLFSIPLFSQINKSFFSTEQEFIYKATDSVLYIIRQDYVLKDTAKKNPSEYGRGGKEYFGRTYFLSISSDNKLWCDSKNRTPWLNDPNYADFQHIDSIKPILSKIAIRQISQKKYQVLDAQIADLKTKADSSLSKIGICYYTPKTSTKGIRCNKETKDSTGWILLAYTQDEISKNDSSIINLAIYKPQVQFKPNEIEATVKAPGITQNILGGVYLNTVFSIGRIDLSFSGILNKKNLSWYITGLPKQVAVQKEDNRLTPIKNETVKEDDSKKTDKKKKDKNR